jgi:hypothetical protein
VTLSITTNDLGHSGTGSPQSDADSVLIDVIAVNDPPLNSIPPSQPIAGGGILILGGGSGTPFSVFDVDAGAAPLQVTLSASVGTLTLASTSGLIFISGDGDTDASMVFTGSQTDINIALDGLTYNAPAVLPTNPSITITTDDLGSTGTGGAQSDTDTLVLNSTYVNAAPVLTLPVAQAMSEDGNLVFSAAGGNAISVDDVDAGSGLLQVTISSTHGALTLSNTTGLTFSTGDGNGDTLMVFTGTLPDIDNALAGLIFTAAANYNGSAAISFTVNDQGNSGLGGAKSTSGSIALTIDAINDPPVLSIASPVQSINEDTTRVFSSGNGNLISISDVDAGSASLQVTLTATDGTLTLSRTTGLTFSAGDGTADAGMMFTGTLSAINAALAGMSFTPDANFNGVASIQIDVDDQGNTGSGGALTASGAVTINVNTVNDPPVNSMPSPQSIIEDTPLTLSTAGGNAIAISDVDAGSGGILKVTLSAADGTLTLASLTGLTFTTGSGSGDTTMTFTGIAGDINTALDGLVYTPTPNFNGATTITIVTNDQGNTGSGGAKSDTDTLNITVSAVNDPPVLTAPAAVQAVNEDSSLTFNSGNGNLIAIADVDASSGDLQVTLTATNGSITLGNTSGLTFTSGDGINDATMTFTGKMSAINSALNGMSFKGSTNYNGAASLAIDVNDQGNTGAGGALSDSAIVLINVNPVNDPPLNSLPGAQTTSEEVPLTFSAAGGNAISISDLDAPSAAILQVTLSAANGTLTLASLGGLTFTAGSGSGDASMTFTGTAANINAALDGLIYTPTTNFNGSTTITIVTNDQGNTGSGGAKSDTDSVNITVDPVNDPPALTFPATTQAADEDTALVFSSANANLIAINDVDAGSGALLVTLTATNGTITLAHTGGLSFTSGDGTADAMMTFKGTLSSINAALNGMSFKGNANYNGAASIAIDVNDQGNTGSGGALSDSGVVSINVAAVNDAPVNAIPAAQAINEDGTLVFSTLNGNAISISDVDAGNAAMMVALASTNGTVTLGGMTGLSFSIGDGTADSSMVFTGTIADINAALNNLTFTPGGDFNGSASVAIVTNDQGSSGAGGAKSDTDGIGITVNAVNDPPVVTVPGAQVINEDTPLIFSSAGGNLIAINDIDAASGNLQVTLTATNGVIALATRSGLSFSVGDGTDDPAMTFTGKLSNINAALDGMIFKPAANFNGAAGISIAVSDLGNTGLGGAKSDAKSVGITINSINDPPTISIPTPKSVSQGTTSVFSSANNNAISIGDVDAGSSPVRLTLAATMGTISLASVSGLTFITGDGTNDATLTVTGSVSDINAALNGLSYTPTTPNPVIGGIQIDVDDQGNTGGPAQMASANLLIEMVNEVLVNTSINATQQLPSVAMDPAGNYVVVWASNHLSNNYGIFAQRYDAFGAPIGSEIQLDASTSNTQTTPAVAMDSSGDFVATWASNESGNWEIVARRFSFATGTALSAEISVNQTTSGNQQQPAIALAPDGHFMAVWRSDGVNHSDVVARVFNANGTPAGGEYVVNVNVTNSQDQPAVAADASGNFVVVWRSVQNGVGAGVFARQYSAAGAAMGTASGGEFQVNVTNSGNQDKPSVAAAWNGAFVVSWTSGNNQDGSGKGVYARRFHASGAPASGEFLVNTTTNNDQDNSTVGMDSVGAFTIAWTSNNQDGFGHGVYAQKYDASGAPDGGEFRASWTTFGDQDQPAVAMSAVSDLAVVWHGNGLGDSNGVFGQFWRSNNHVPIISVPAATQSTAEESALIFSSGNGNAISVGSASPSLRIALVATQGLISLATIAGLTFSAGDGSVDSAMIFTGTPSAINAALASLRYDPDLNYNGPAEIHITTTDSSTGTPVSDEAIAAIIVTPVNDAPTTSGLADVSVAEDAPDTRIDLLSRFSDIEDAAANLAYTLQGDTNSALFDSVAIDPQTHELVLKYAANASGSATFTLRASDSGGLFIEATFAVTVGAVNDPPTLATDTGATLETGQTIVVTRAMLRVDDIDNTADQLTYTITELPTQGTVRLNDIALGLGDSFTQADLDAGRVTYAERGIETSDAFGFEVSDGSGGTIAPAQFALTIELPPPPPPTTPPPPPPQTPTPPGGTLPPVIGTPGSSSSSSSSSSDVGTTDDSSSDSVIDKTGKSSSSGTIPSVTNSSGGSSSSSAAASAAPAQAPADNANNNPPPAARAPETPAEVAKPPLAAARDPISVAPSAIPAPIAPLAPAPVAPALPPPPPAAPIAFIVKPDSIITQKLDEMREKVTKDEPVLNLVAGSAQWASVAASVIYILWTIRAGYLLASLLSSMPAWTFVDPLPILDHFNDPSDPDRKKRRKDDDDDEESLQNLVERQSKASSGSGAQGELS